MKNQLFTGTELMVIQWEENSGIINSIKTSASLEGTANNIGGEVFFYQYELDIPFNGEEKEIFEPGDVVYWRSLKTEGKFGILLMYGNTSYGDGTKPRTSSPGIKIGSIKDFQKLSSIETGTLIRLG